MRRPRDYRQLPGGGSGGGGGGVHSRHGHVAKLWPQLGFWMGDEDQESLGVGK